MPRVWQIVAMSVLPVVVELLGQRQLLRVGQLLRPTPFASPGSRRGQTRLGPLADEIPLELGQGPENMEDQLAPRCRRVDLLGQAPEANPPLRQGRNRLDQMRQRATQAVESPDDERVPRPEIRERFFKSRPAGFGATGDILEDPATSRRREGVALQVEGLVTSGDPGIANQHPRIVSKPMRNGKQRNGDFETDNGIAIARDCAGGDADLRAVAETSVSETWSRGLASHEDLRCCPLVTRSAQFS
jgi:hypothetical protein